MERTAQLLHSVQIGNGQRVIGLAQNCRGFLIIQLAHHLGQYLRIGIAGAQKIVHYIGIFRLADIACLGSLCQKLNVPGFTAEGDLVHISQRREQCHAAHSKVFCRCQGIRNRKLQHQVYPCLDCQSGTGKFVQNCRIAALHKVSAHNGNNAVCAAFPHLAQMIQMAIVQGIVFADNTTDFHVKSSKKMCGKCKIYRIRLRISANLLHFPQKGL